MRILLFLGLAAATGAWAYREHHCARDGKLRGMNLYPAGSRKEERYLKIVEDNVAAFATWRSQLPRCGPLARLDRASRDDRHPPTRRSGSREALEVVRQPAAIQRGPLSPCLRPGCSCQVQAGRIFPTLREESWASPLPIGPPPETTRRYDRFLQVNLFLHLGQVITISSDMSGHANDCPHAVHWSTTYGWSPDRVSFCEAPAAAFGPWKSQASLAVCPFRQVQTPFPREWRPHKIHRDRTCGVSSPPILRQQPQRGTRSSQPPHAWHWRQP